jgi:hypothetical protein
MATAATELDPSRNGARKRVLIRGTLFSSQGTHVIWIRDISPTGALVSSQDRLPAYGDVALKRGGMFVAARVMASTEAGAELQFYRELKATEIDSATVATPQHD